MKKLFLMLLIAGGFLFAAANAEAGRRGHGYHNHHHHHGYGGRSYSRRGFSININRGYPSAYGYGNYYSPYRRSVGINYGVGYGYGSYGVNHYNSYPAYGGGYCH